jgi:hypothetical protein
MENGRVSSRSPGWRGACAAAVCLATVVTSETTWAQGYELVQELRHDEVRGSVGLGEDVDIEGDRMLVGTNLNESGGRFVCAFVYERDEAGAWVKQAELEFVSETNNGCSVSLSGDTALLGAWHDEGNGSLSGAAYIFERNVNGKWAQVARFVNGTGRWGRFGWEVHLIADMALVGTSVDESAGLDGVGSVYVYKRLASGDWEQVQLLVEPGEPLWPVGFGQTIDVSGDRVLIAAAGRVHTYTRNTSGLLEHEATVTPPEDRGRTNHGYGIHAALHDDRVIVGMPGNGELGVTYVYEWSPSGEWVPAGTIESAHSVMGDSFGREVVLDGDRAFVGVMLHHATAYSGQVHAFRRDAAGQWVEPSPPLVSSVGEGDGFGAAFAYSDGRLVVGAPDTTTGPEQQHGKAYVYDLTRAARDDEAMTREDTAVEIDVLTNDSTSPGEVVISGLTGFGAGGRGVINEDMTVSYTPAPDFHGVDSFMYTLTDGDDVDTATVTVHVEPTNDPPTASDAEYAGTNLGVAITLEGEDVDGDGLSFFVSEPPMHGVLRGDPPELTYVATGDHEGVDTFEFVASDGQTLSAPATVTVEVTRLPNTAPEFVEPTPEAGQTLQARVGELFRLALHARDPDGPYALRYEVLEGPEPLRINPDTGVVTWRPSLSELEKPRARLTVAVSDGRDTTSRGMFVEVAPPIPEDEVGPGQGSGGSEESPGSGCATLPASPSRPLPVWLLIAASLSLCARRRHRSFLKRGGSHGGRHGA